MAVQLDERFWSKVNKNAPSGCWEWTASKYRDGYGQFWLDGKNVRAHRASYAMRNSIAPGAMIDHLCHNRACVNPAHLREASNALNGQNRSGSQRNNKSTGIRGVYKHSKVDRYMAVARLNGKRHYLGNFKTIDEANEVVTAWRREHMPYSAMDNAA